LLIGLGLAQVGEFSFVLARIGVTEGTIPAQVFDLILATALVTIVLTPTLLRGAPFLQLAIERLPLARTRIAEPDAGEVATDGMRGQTIIAGYGRVGRELADALHRRGEGYVVVEYNPAIVRELRARGVPVLYGDAANPVVLEHAGLAAARLLAVLVPDVATAELATRHARRISPHLDIVARVSRAEEVARLRRAGASEVVQPEFEAGVEVIRHALLRLGADARGLDEQTVARREAFYRSQLNG